MPKKRVQYQESQAAHDLQNWFNTKLRQLSLDLIWRVRSEGSLTKTDCELILLSGFLMPVAMLISEHPPEGDEPFAEMFLALIRHTRGEESDDE